MASYIGKAVFSAVNNVNQKIAPIVIGKNADDYKNIDQSMIALDNTNNKSILGANAILGASMSIVNVLDCLIISSGFHFTAEEIKRNERSAKKCM